MFIDYFKTVFNLMLLFTVSFVRLPKYATKRIDTVITALLRLYSVVYFTGDGWFIGATDKAVDGEYIWMNGRTKLSQVFNNWVPGSMDNNGKDEVKR